jgi:ATP-binding protein involved in chromosome partitioning|tara:strand:+ start:1814 stop:2641 length:828 start_codon:yes stop_codon:yes gene_type:complete
MNQIVNNKLRIPETLRKVKNIVGVFSAKGGVGKSAVALQIAISLKNKGFTVGLVDADIYGPSQAVLLKSEPGDLQITDNKIIEPMDKQGISFISMGLISNEKKPVIWRGPMVSGAVMQLLSQTNWGELDYLIIDTPPGTGDVQLTLLQKIPLTGTVVVTTPQNVAISDCRKGIEMIKKLSIPVLGLIENMSWFQPDESNKKYFLFGKDGGKELADEYKVNLLAQIPLVERSEEQELYEIDYIKETFEKLTDEVVLLLKKERSNKIDSIPQTTVTK